MTSSEKLLILSAGRGIGLDGFHKLNLVSPETKETTLNRYMRQFGKNVTIVVGYRAAELISTYPDLDYVYNYAWFETGSAFSAHLGLSKAPVTVVPSDLFISDEVANMISAMEDNAIYMINTENRGPNSINISYTNNCIVDIYQGSRKSGDDAEFCGIVKIVGQKILDEVSISCQEHSPDFFIESLVRHKENFKPCLLPDGVLEINTIEDYLLMMGQKG